MRVLLVEDEQPLAKYVAAGLRKHGFAVDAWSFRCAASYRKRLAFPADPRALSTSASPKAGDASNLPASAALTCHKKLAK
jgi:hypothetical protein